MALPLEQEVYYPESDGQPMGETTLHREVMAETIGALSRRHAGVPDVWVGGNLFLYYEKGNPKKCVAPDVLLVQGVAKWPRKTYRLWEETAPALIFEITSQETWREDQNLKKDLYEHLGVTELVFFDPYGEYLEPRLQGYRLERGRYQPIPPNRDGSLDLQTAGVTVRPEGERLRLVDAASGEKLLWSDELGEARQQEAAARQAAEERAAAAEERARALAEELDRLRRGSK